MYTCTCKHHLTGLNKDHGFDVPYRALRSNTHCKRPPHAMPNQHKRRVAIGGPHVV